MKQLVGVYGTLRKDLHNHDFLKSSKFIREVKTEPRYTMVVNRGLPFLLDGGSTQVTLEVYEVDIETMASLDRLEGHPTFYTRKKVEIDKTKMWVYFYNKTDVVSTGDYKDYIELMKTGV